MKISARCSSIAPSLTLALTAKAKALRAEGRDVLSFGAGEPDFDTPDFIKQVAIEDLQAGKTKYTAAKGGPEILGAVQRALKRDYGLEYSEGELLVSVGGKHSLYNLFQGIVDAGDEVIVPAPFWLSYPEQIKAASGEPVIVNCGPEQGFLLTAAQLEAAITPRTVAVILNSPSNPTGVVYPRERLAELADVLRRHPNVALVSDDLYQKLVYAPAEFVGILSVAPDLRDRTFIVNGWSKAYSMTGWRLGWMAGPPKPMKAISSLQSHATSNVTTFCQRAAAVALDSDHEFLKPWVKAFQERRRALIDGLKSIDGFSVNPEPQGAFYVFPDVSGTFGREIAGKKIGGSMDLAELLLEKADVSIVPGAAFGEDRCARLSYATSTSVIERGVERLRKLLG